MVICFSLSSLAHQWFVYQIETFKFQCASKVWISNFIFHYMLWMARSYFNHIHLDILPISNISWYLTFPFLIPEHYCAQSNTHLDIRYWWQRLLTVGVLKVESVIESGDFSDIPKNETYAAFYFKGWSGIEDEHAGEDIWMCVCVNFDRQPSSIPSFLTIGPSNGIHPLTFLYGYNFNVNSITSHWYEKRTQFWQILLETQCCFCLLSLSSSIHWGLALTSTTNQILCLAFHISCLAFFKTDFWLFDECGVSCTQRAMRWVGSVFLQVHIIGKPLLTHVARNILFLQEILFSRNSYGKEYLFAMNSFCIE